MHVHLIVQKIQTSIKLANNKMRIIILNKADLADEAVTKAWIDWYSAHNVKVVPIIATSGKGIKEVVKIAEDLLREKIERDKARGRIYRPIRAMIVGIPNVGKSTFINALVGKKSAKTGDKPGVTRGKQWVKIRKGFELLDMPGILWPKFEDQTVAQHLAFIGSINDNILDNRQLAINLLDLGLKEFKDKIEDRYKVELPDDGYEAFKTIAVKRGLIIAGGEIDELRTAQIILDEFRGGKWGHITVEHPKNI